MSTDNILLQVTAEFLSEPENVSKISPAIVSAFAETILHQIGAPKLFVKDSPAPESKTVPRVITTNQELDELPDKSIITIHSDSSSFIGIYTKRNQSPYAIPNSENWFNQDNEKYPVNIKIGPAKEIGNSYTFTLIRQGTESQISNVQLD